MRKGLNSAGSTWLALSKPGLWIILVPAIVGSVLGFLLSFSFPQKYISQSLILVEPAYSPQSVEHSSLDSGQPLSQLQDVLTGDKLKPTIDRMGLGNVDQEMAEIRRRTRFIPVALKVNDSRAGGMDSASTPQLAKAFGVEYTASSPAEAQLMCNAVTSVLLQENLDIAAGKASASADNLQIIHTAKRDLDEQNAKLAQFKKRHDGQLPGDVEKNLSQSEHLHAQLNMLSEKIQLAQQNKADAESLLRQQSSAHPKIEKHDPPPKAENAAALEKQLSDLQSQLLQLQAQYTDDHPDVVKTKASIASVEKRLADLKANNAVTNSDADAPAAQQETAEIRQLRSRIQQNEQVIDAATLQQKRIQNQVSVLQAKLADEPDLESEYEQLLRDRDTAQKKYAIAKANAAADHPSTDNSPARSGRVRMLSPATIPRTPSFPNRLFFAISGWLGLAVVMRLALWITQADSSRAPNTPAPQAKAFSNNT